MKFRSQSFGPLYFHCSRFLLLFKPQLSPTGNHHSSHYYSTIAMADPKGTIIFSTVGRPQYGFDVFSVNLPARTAERRLTDGISINFNAQFIDEDQSIVYISERIGSPRIYLNRSGIPKPELLLSPPQSLFHDRPIIKNGRLYFISAHEPADKPFKSWSALYTTELRSKNIVRLTPKGYVDYSPSISQSAKFIAVASYGSRDWSGEFHELQTDIVVFRESDPEKRVIVCRHGGWPTWSGDSTVYFHRQADDGWWSIFRLDLPDNFEITVESYAPRRITPAGLHCFTPVIVQNSNQIVVATRRRDKSYRHIEIFDVDLQKFYPVTELINPNFHHYNPFISPDSGFIGYHRYRGESSAGETVIPYLDPVSSPFNSLRMLRINGNFPAFSPDGNLVAYNHGLSADAGVNIVKSDGSKRWTLLKDRIAFHNSWSPTEKNVIYTSIGPIFESVKATVQIARISFDPANLTDDREEVPINIKILTREDTGNNAFSSCSPDGKFLVFRSGRSGHKNLYIVDAVNGEFDGGIRQLTEGPWIDTMPSWSPDGKLIAFSSNRHNPDDVSTFSIYVIHPDGTGLKRIHVAGSEVDRERINHVCFSADGEWLLFAANLGGVTAEPASLPNQFQPYGDLYAARLDENGLKRLTWNGYENGTPAWHPGNVMDLERLDLRGEMVGDKLKGEFDEPLWISCDF